MSIDARRSLVQWIAVACLPLVVFLTIVQFFGDTLLFGAPDGDYGEQRLVSLPEDAAGAEPAVSVDPDWDVMIANWHRPARERTQPVDTGPRNPFDVAGEITFTLALGSEFSFQVAGSEVTVEVGDTIPFRGGSAGQRIVLEDVRVVRSGSRPATAALLRATDGESVWYKIVVRGDRPEGFTAPQEWRDLMESGPDDSGADRQGLHTPTSHPDADEVVRLSPSDWSHAAEQLEAAVDRGDVTFQQVPATGGLRVLFTGTDVEWARTFHVQPKDTIISVNGRPIQRLTELRHLRDDPEMKDATEWVIVYRRKGVVRTRVVQR